MSGLYIKKFLDKLQQQELKGGREVILTMQEAKNLHSDITKLLLDIQQFQQTAIQNQQDTTIQVEGGTF